MSRDVLDEQTMRDRCNMEVIYGAFEKLSTKGKGVIIENLVREYAKEKK